MKYYKIDHLVMNWQHQNNREIKVIPQVLNLVDYGFNKDGIEASLSQGTNDIYDTFCRVQALHEFRLHSHDQFNSLYEVYKRAKDQLDGQKICTVSPDLLVELQEKNLNTILDKQHKPFQEALSNKKYNDAYALIATIQLPLADLFDNVKILADDPKQRENRLALLQRVFVLFGQILDFSKIQAGK